MSDRKTLSLGNTAITLEDYARARELSDSEAARRLIKQGLKHEQQPTLTDRLIETSILLSAFTAILLAIFGTIEPILFLFAALAFMFMAGIGIAQLVTQRDTEPSDVEHGSPTQ